MPQELYQELLTRLSRLRKRRDGVALSVGLFSGLTVMVLVALIAIIAEMLGHFSIPGRTWLFWSALLLAVGGFTAFVAMPLLVRLGIKKRVSDDELAIAVGRHYPEVSDRLANALQLARPLFLEGQDLYGSPRFAMAAFETTYNTVRTVDFNAIVDDRPMRRSGLLFVFSLLIGLALFFGMRNEMMAATTRLTHYNTFYQKPAPFTFVVFPGNARVMRGDSLRVTVATRGEQLPKIVMLTREEGQKEFDKTEIVSSPLDSTFVRQGFKSGFTYTLHAQHPVEYFAEARDIESQRFHLSVLDHPIVRSLNVTATPPAYTHGKAVKLNENIGDISGPVGTRGDVRIAASAKLKSATLVFQPAPTLSADSQQVAHAPRPAKLIPLVISQDSLAAGAVTFLESGSYHIDLLDADSVPSEHPIEYTVTVSRDEPPTIALIEPSDRSDLPSNMRLEMLARIHDDYGYRSVRLAYRISKSKYLPAETSYKWLDVPLSSYSALDLDVPYIWNLTPLGLAPEDEVSYLLEVTDNDAISGGKTARTPEFTLRLPSIKEIFERADAQANKSERDLNEIKQDAQELQKKVDEALNEMKQMKASDIARSQQDFSKRKDMQQIAERQKELNQRLDQVGKELEQMTKQMDQQNALSPETLQKYQELQKLFEQINSPELKAAMQKLQQTMQQQQVDPKQMQEAMKNLQTNEEQFRKQIERTANILKKIQAEQKVDELMKRSSELAKQEQKASDKAQEAMDKGKQLTPEEQAAAERAQEDAKKELERMQQEAKDLAAQMKKLPENMQTPEEMNAAQQALQDPSTQNSMDNAQQAAKKGDQMRSKQNAQDAANKMKNAQKKLADLKKKMSENEKQRNMREMKQLRDEMNRLSKQEEQIKNKVQQAAPNSNVYRDLAEQQSQLKEQLGQAASKAMQMAQRSTAITPEMGKSMGEAFANMQKSQDAMSDRNQSGAQQGSQGAMSALNKLAQQMQSMMQSMAQSGSSGGTGGEGEEGEGSGDGQGGSGAKPGGQSGQGGSAMQQFLNQINKLTAQQQSLNNQMQAMAQGQSGGGQQAQKDLMRQQAEMQRIAAQQQAVQKTLQDLANEQKQSQNGSKIAGDDLRKIADEMQEVVSQMRTSGVRPETVQRQERILSRLLEAQRSTHERDKEEQRESKSGQNVTRESPSELVLSPEETKRQIQQELEHTRETGYSKDYNALIRKYFEQLEKVQQK